MERYLIITCGATGSGKTTLAKKTIELINKSLKPKYRIKKHNTVYVLVDELIENNFDYKRRVDKILKKYLLGKPCKDGKCVNDFPPRVYDEFKDAYFQSRNKSCQTIDTNSCNELNDVLLSEAFDSNKNVVFESTCNYFPEWLINLVPSNYKIIISYTIVNFCNLLDRNRHRAANQLKNYLKDKINNPAPRLPDLAEPVFKGILNSIRNNLIKNVYSCINTHEEQCGNTPFDLVVFNNNPKQIRLVYHIKHDDRVKPNIEEFTKTIDNLFKLNDKCCKKKSSV